MDQKNAYLDHWQASPEWRGDLAFRLDHVGFDLEADARESAEWRLGKRYLAKDHLRPFWVRWILGITK